MHKNAKNYENLQTKSCGYPYESFSWVLSDEYPYAKVEFILQVFASFCIGKLATSSIRVNDSTLHSICVPSFVITAI